MNDPHHERVGLVGFSGSGKSSFVSLILRLFDRQSGQILIDGTDIRDMRQDSLHAQLSPIHRTPACSIAACSTISAMAVLTPPMRR